MIGICFCIITFWFISKYNQIEEEDKETGQKTIVTTYLTLEVDDDEKTLIEVHKEIVRKLKPHQVEGNYHHQAIQDLSDNQYMITLISYSSEKNNFFVNI